MTNKAEQQDTKHPPKCVSCRRKGVILVWNEIKKMYEELICMKCRNDDSEKFEAKIDKLVKEEQDKKLESFYFKF